MSKRESLREGETGATATAERGRRVQEEIDRKESAQPDAGKRDQKPQSPQSPQSKDPAAQLGQRRHPEPPAQPLEKPGLEADLTEKPRFEAPARR